MIAAAVLASFLAQAEQAPEPPPPPAPAPAPAPSSFPAAATVRPNMESYGLTILGRVASRENPGRALDPSVGFSLGGTFERRAPLGFLDIDSGIAVDFFYTRFSTGVIGLDGENGTRSLAQTSFALLRTIARPRGVVRPFGAFGAGVMLSYFSTPEPDLRPGSLKEFQPLARLVAGLEVGLSPTVAFVLRADYTHTFFRPTFTTATGQSYSFLGDLLEAGVGLRLGF